MIALLLATFAQLFWQHELGLLRREILDDRGMGEERMLFDDLLALGTCAPLSRLAEPSPMRQLVRVEAARRVRLGKAAGSSRTVWRDLLRPGFFSVAILNPKPSKALYWIDEKEKWPNETLLVQSPAWLCGKLPAWSAEEQITQELISSQEPRTAALLAYERAAVQFRAGKALELHGLETEQLPANLRPYARFLRLEAGADPREGFAELAAVLPEPIVLDRAAQALYDAGRFAEVVKLTEGKPPRFSLWMRALSLLRLGREDEMLDALARGFAASSAGFAPGGPASGGPASGAGASGVSGSGVASSGDASTEPLRELAMQTLARRPLDEKKLAFFAVKGAEEATLLQLGQRALAAGNVATARAVAQALADEPKARNSAAGLALQGESAFVSGDAEALRDALALLFPAGGGYGRGALAGPKAPRVPGQLRVADRDERDHAAVALAQALAGRAHDRPELAALLEETFARLREGVHIRYAREIDSVAETLHSTVARDLQRVAVGEIKIANPPQPPPPPKAELELPEPFSLLAIPVDDGSLRSWFAGPEVVDAH